MNIIRTWNVSLGALQRHREGFKSAIKKILFILQNVNIFHSDIQLLIKNNTILLRVGLMILLGTPSPWISEFLVAHLSPRPTVPCPIGWQVLPRRLWLPATGCRAGGPSWGTGSVLASSPPATHQGSPKACAWAQVCIKAVDAIWDWA